MASTNPEARWAAVRARLDAKAAQRHAARVTQVQGATRTRESQLRARIDAAVQEALREAQAPVTEVAPAVGAPVAESAPAPSQQPGEGRALTSEQFKQASAEYWSRRAESMNSPSWRPRQPQTLSQFLGREEPTQ